jgi:hypothetical protein
MLKDHAEIAASDPGAARLALVEMFGFVGWRIDRFTDVGWRSFFGSNL